MNQKKQPKECGNIFFYPNSSYISGNSADYKCAYL